ncbi:hypothetical protein ACFV0C_28720 [Streptomyces sp. NPDC059568]|uniref:hypothetical protein n=1 Tax=Streptomyces sp. NPDC059568 TaxID=3346868 RepID=UPI00367C1236
MVPNDGADDTSGIQQAIDDIKRDCSPTAWEFGMSRITLPVGIINVSRQISVDADLLVLRGAGSDPETGTRFVFRPDENTRYDFFNNEILKQIAPEQDKCVNYYPARRTIYQFDWGSGKWQHLTAGTSPIQDWQGSELRYYGASSGVDDSRSDDRESLFLERIVRN